MRQEQVEEIRKNKAEKEKQKLEDKEQQRIKKREEKLIDSKVTVVLLIFLILSFLILAFIEWGIFSDTSKDKIDYLTIATLVFSVYSMIVFNAIEPIIRIVLKYYTKNINVSNHREYIDYQINSVELSSLIVIIIGLIIVVFIYLIFV